MELVGTNLVGDAIVTHLEDHASDNLFPHAGQIACRLWGALGKEGKIKQKSAALQSRMFHAESQPVGD